MSELLLQDGSTYEQCYAALDHHFNNDSSDCLRIHCKENVEGVINHLGKIALIQRISCICLNNTHWLDFTHEDNSWQVSNSEQEIELEGNYS